MHQFPSFSLPPLSFPLHSPSYPLNPPFPFSLFFFSSKRNGSVNTSNPLPEPLPATISSLHFKTTVEEKTFFYKSNTIVFFEPKLGCWVVCVLGCGVIMWGRKRIGRLRDREISNKNFFFLKIWGLKCNVRFWNSLNDFLISLSFEVPWMIFW